MFATIALPTAPDLAAPDGSEVRLLAGMRGGTMAHFRLHPGQISRAVRHRTVEEIWYILAGEGAMWRDCDGQTEITPLTPGLSLTIPVGTAFQFRAGAGGLAAVAITMPPWPGANEAVFVPGPWEGTQT